MSDGSSPQPQQSQPQILPPPEDVFGPLDEVFYTQLEDLTENVKAFKQTMYPMFKVAEAARELTYFTTSLVQFPFKTIENMEDVLDNILKGNPPE